MITKAQAVAFCHGHILHHVSSRNADGTPVRCRVNGKCKTWKTFEDEFRLPVKHGLRRCFYITPNSADEWFDPAVEVLVASASPVLEPLPNCTCNDGKSRWCPHHGELADINNASGV